MILRLRSGSASPCERVEEALLGIDANDVHAHVLGERLHDLIAFVLPQQAVIDEHARELIADRAMQQRADDGRIDAAGQAEQHAVAADLLAHARDRVGDDVAARPSALRSRRSRARSARAIARPASCASLRDGTARRRSGATRPPSPRAARCRVKPTHDEARRQLRRRDRRGSSTHRAAAVPCVVAVIAQIRRAALHGARDASPAHNRTRDAAGARRGRRAAAPSSACRSKCRAPARRARTPPAARAGGSASVTDSGPPERMMPRRAEARTSASLMSQGWISQ